jgi:hypothetical protein
MVSVSPKAKNETLAWRVRDVLARHPLLGGAMAQISVDACKDAVVLRGWVVDQKLEIVAVRLAKRAAGRRPVQIHLTIGQPV